MSHEIVVCGVPFGTPEERQALRIVKDAGFTSVQIYVFWNRIEPQRRGEFDWSYYDRQVKLIQEAGLKWVPFLIFGPAYGFPKWWLESDRHVGYRCLEHNTENAVESLWNPVWRDEVTRLLTAFAGHYLPMNVIESVQPGITGDYGEAIFPAVGNWPGMYHTHRGYWCMDDYAQADFRRAMREKYGSVEAMNAKWRSHYADFEELRPFLRHKAPSRTAYFDMMMWYKASMTDYDAFFRRTAVSRTNSAWTMSVSGSDAKLTGELALAWLDAARERLLDAQEHAIKAEALRNELDGLTRCVQYSAENVPASVCPVVEEGILDKYAARIIAEENVSHGLPSAVRVGASNPNALTLKPASRGAAFDTLLGALCGLIAAFAFVRFPAEKERK